jgi:AcrR family transcriptional regulator
MPIEVDATERLEQIAKATLRVAERDGTRAITIRSVAAELGGSTAVVTNYVGTRAELLLNVVLHAQQRWNADMEQAIEGREGIELLRALVLWSLTTRNHDPEIRRLWVDLASSSGPESAAPRAVSGITMRHRGLIRDALAEVGTPDPDVEADMLYLMIRGFYFLVVEDSDGWTEERVVRAVESALDGILSNSRPHAG